MQAMNRACARDWLLEFGTSFVSNCSWCWIHMEQSIPARFERAEIGVSNIRVARLLLMQCGFSVVCVWHALRSGGWLSRRRRVLARCVCGCCAARRLHFGLFAVGMEHVIT
jgi:hypothetical protein